MLFATIEHSGTHRTIGLLRLKPRPLDEEHWPCAHPEEFTLFSHLDDLSMPLVLDAAERMPILTTYRDPAAIRASWERRGKSIEMLNRQFANYARLLEFRPYVLHLGRPE